MLTIVTPYQKSPARQRTQVYLFTLVNFLIFSILVSLFRLKNRGMFRPFCSVTMLIENDQGIPSNSYFKRLRLPRNTVPEDVRRVHFMAQFQRCL
jgi:hypothetical protein